MKFIFRWVLRLLFLALILVALALVMRNSLGTWTANSLIRNTTGFNSSIAYLNIQLSSPLVVAREISLLNPDKNIQEPIAFKISRINLSYEPISLFKGETRIQKMVIDIDEAILVHARTGGTNWSRLDGRSIDFQDYKVAIDELEISINRLVLVDEALTPASLEKHAVTDKKGIYRGIKNTKMLRKSIYETLLKSSPEKWQLMVKNADR